MRIMRWTVPAMLLACVAAYAGDAEKKPVEPWDAVPVELFPAELDGKWGFIDRYGQIAIGPQYECAWDFTEGLARVQVKGLRGFIDRTGKMVVEPKYYLAWPFSEGLAAVMIPKGKFDQTVNAGVWAYVDRAGNIAIPPSGPAKWAGDFHEGKALYKTHGSGYQLNVYLNKQGRSWGFYRGPQDFHEGRAAVMIGRQWGYFNHEMKYAIQGKFDAARDFSEGVAPVKLGDKWGYIDKAGNFVIEPRYEDAYPFSEGLAGVKQEGKYGWIDKTGAVVIKPQFDFVAPFSEGLARVMAGGKHGYVDRSGTVIVEPKYDVGWEFSKGLARVETGGKENYIDRSGADVWNDERREVQRKVLSFKDAAPCRAFIKENAGNPYAGNAGLTRLAGILGAKAFDDLVAAMKGGGPEVLPVAARLIGALDGEDITKRLIDQMNAAKGAVRAHMLVALSERGDTAALDAARASIGDKDESVRLAAITCTARLGGKESVPALLDVLRTGGAKERQAATTELGRIPGREATDALAEASKDAAPAVRASIIGALAARGAVGHVGIILEAAKHEDKAVRLAALAALGSLAGESHLAEITSLLTASKSDDERKAAEDSLCAIAEGKIEKKEESAEIVAKAMADASPAARGSLLRVLGRIGGMKGAEAAEAAVTDGEKEVSDTAVGVLAKWPDAAAAPALLKIARETRDEDRRALARVNYVRLLRMPNKRKPEETLEMCRAGMEIAGEPGEKKVLLGILAWVKTVDAMKTVEGYLGEEGLEADAGRALLSIAGGVSGTHPKETKETLKKFQESSKDEPLKKQAQDIIGKIEMYEDYVQSWLVSGPHAQEGKSASQLLDVVFPPEDPGSKDVKWKELSAGSWSIDLVKVVGNGSNCAAYLRSTVEAAEAGEALLELGTDDGVKVWLNGEVVHKNDVMRGVVPGQDKVKVNLNAGDNVLLLKVNQGGGGWGACARFRKPDGGKLEGLQYHAK